MKLSRVERCLLANQYRILELLDKHERDGYAIRREALEQGYELEFAGVFSQIHTDVLSEDDCREVMDILDMYTHLRRSFDALGPSDRLGISEGDLRFPGFDGNHEGFHLAYARHLGKTDRWSNLLGDEGNDLNSHVPTLEMYRRMLDVYRGLESRSARLEIKDLANDEIMRIVAARIDPPARYGCARETP